MSTARSPESDPKAVENEDVGEGSLERMETFGRRVAAVTPDQLAEAQERLDAARGPAKRYPKAGS
jgi:predicted Zn-dependent peptidase